MCHEFETAIVEILDTVRDGKVLETLSRLISMTNIRKDHDLINGALESARRRVPLSQAIPNSEITNALDNLSAQKDLYTSW